MSRLFANNTEGGAWEGVWCGHCQADINDDCPIHTALLCTDDIPPEITEQPEGEFHLPPLHLCAGFIPMPEGDPLADIRATVIAHVTAARAARGGAA